MSGRHAGHLFAGELGPAAELLQELENAAGATGGLLAPYCFLGYAAWRGREAELKNLVSRQQGAFHKVVMEALVPDLTRANGCLPPAHARQVLPLL